MLISTSNASVKGKSTKFATSELLIYFTLEELLQQCRVLWATIFILLVIYIFKRSGMYFYRYIAGHDTRRQLVWYLWNNFKFSSYKTRLICLVVVTQISWVVLSLMIWFLEMLSKTVKLWTKQSTVFPWFICHPRKIQYTLKLCKNIYMYQWTLAFN